MSKRNIVIGLILVIIILVFAVGIYYNSKSKPQTPSGLGIYNVDKINLTNLQTDKEKKLLAETKEKLKNNPQDVEAIITLATLEKWNENYDQAINTLLVAKQLRQGDNLILNNLADLYIISKQFDKAEATLLELISYDSQWINAYIMLYDIYRYNLLDVLKTDKLPNLLKDGMNKDFLKKHESDWYRLLGNYYRDVENNEEAIAWYEKYLALNPDNKDLKEQLEQLKAK